MKSTYTPTKLDERKGRKACWQNVYEHYKISKKVGEGSFGSVYKAKCRTTGKRVAIKHINDSTTHDYGLIKLLREIQIMRKLHEKSYSQKSTFVPQLIDVIIPDNERTVESLKNVFIVMEYEVSDLYDTIDKGSL